jgi:DNA-binding PadR family transcriptional regulator
MASRVTLTPIALAVMELLHEGPRHPYDLSQTMQERETWRLLKVTVGSLYHAIDRLAGDGLIQAVETTREGRRPERTTYCLTQAGRDAYTIRVRDIIAHPATEYPLYALAIALLHTLDRADALSQLRKRAIALEAAAAADRVYSRRLTEQAVPELYWVDVDLKLRLREAELTWTRELVERLETERLPWPVGGDSGCTDTDDTPRLSLVNEQRKTR